MRCLKCEIVLPFGLENCPACNTPYPINDINNMDVDSEGMKSPVRILTGVLVNNRYNVKERIGQGCMSQVFLAHDEDLDQDVVLKSLPLGFTLDSDAGTRLKQGIRKVVVSLFHRCFIQIHHVDVWQEQVYVVIEYVESDTLAHYLDNSRDQKISLDESLLLLSQIAQGLDFAHQQEHPVVHLNITPQNIFLDADNNVKITTFSLSRVTSDSTSHISNPTVGFSAYMAPEQVRGKDISPATDIYALGCVAYKMLSGHPPLAIGRPLSQSVNELPEPIHGQPDHVNNALLSALSKKQEDRPDTAGEFVHMLSGDASLFL